jgi:hypothetical protein
MEARSTRTEEPRPTELLLNGETEKEVLPTSVQRNNKRDDRALQPPAVLRRRLPPSSAPLTSVVAATLLISQLCVDFLK